MENISFFSTDTIELKEDKKDSFVLGYISTGDKDIVNDIVTKNCMDSMFNQMKGRNIKFDVEHESFRGKTKTEIELNKTINPIAKVDWFGKDADGLLVKALLNKHHPRFNEVKGSIQDGFLDAFSIAYIPKKVNYEEIKGEKIRRLDDIQLLNVAFTGNPINERARITDVFLKSIDDIEMKPKDQRPPKAWWDSCTSKSGKFADDPKKFCGWLYQQSGGKMGKLKQSFGKSGEMLDTKSLMKNEVINLTEEEKPKEEEPKPVEEKIEAKSTDLEKIITSLKSIENRINILEKKSKEEMVEEKKEDAIISEMKAIKKELKELKSAPQYKAIQEDMKKELTNAESKSAEVKGPLDVLF